MQELGCQSNEQKAAEVCSGLILNVGSNAVWSSININELHIDTHVCVNANYSSRSPRRPFAIGA